MNQPAAIGTATAKGQNLSISTKHCIEICSWLRYRTTVQAKRLLDEVMRKKQAVPFKRFKRNIGHKPGMAAGRYPLKATQAVLQLINAVEANAQFKGLSTGQLKIVKILANRAAVPFTGGRRFRKTKRTHLEITVREKKEQKVEKKGK